MIRPSMFPAAVPAALVILAIVMDRNAFTVPMSGPELPGMRR